MDNPSYESEDPEKSPAITENHETNTHIVSKDSLGEETKAADNSKTDFVPGSKDDPFRGYRIGKQTLLVLVYIGIGMYAEIVGPTLPDLKDRVGVNYEVISQVLVSRSVGSMVGSIMGGFIHERFYDHCELILACALWLASIVTVTIPYGTYLPVVATLFAVSGISEGIINAGANTLVMDLWKEKTAGPMNSLHFGFGFGALITPQIARPFLSPDAKSVNEDPISTAAPTTLAWNATEAIPADSQIEICYAIVSLIVFAFGFIVLGVYLKGQPKGFVIRSPSGKWKEMVQPSICGHGHAFFALELLVVLFFYFIAVVGGEKVMGQFLFSYAVESDVQFTKADASVLQTTFWASFTAGRLLGIPLSSFVPMWIIMLVDTVGATVLGIVMSFYGSDRIALWVISSLLGLFMSMGFPNGMSWANIHLNMNSVAVMILDSGGGCGGLIFQYLTGYWFERDPENFPYVLTGYGGGFLITFIIMQTLAVVHGRKIHREKDQVDIEDKIFVVSDKGYFSIIDTPPIEYDEGTRL